jgi:hypothetical protein
MSYTGRDSKPRMSRRRALPAHFLAPEDHHGHEDGLSNSTVYPGLVDEYDDPDEDVPEISYFWD